MKKVFFILSALMVLGATATAFAKDDVLPPTADRTAIENNLIAGLSVPNAGLQRSCALMLGKIEADRAVVPLLDVLHNNPDENVRIAAAWALCKIGNGVGVYAVRMAVSFDESNAVKTKCAWFYDTYIQKGTFTFSQTEPSLAESKK